MVARGLVFWGAYGEWWRSWFVEVRGMRGIVEDNRWYCVVSGMDVGDFVSPACAAAAEWELE